MATLTAYEITEFANRKGLSLGVLVVGAIGSTVMIGFPESGKIVMWTAEMVLRYLENTK